MKTAGIIILLLAVIGLLVGFNMDTSVAVVEIGENVRFVNNLGLMNNQQNIIIIAGVMAVIGTILFAIAGKNTLTLSTSEMSQNLSQRTRQCPFCAELVKAEAIICRFCRKEIPSTTVSVVELNVGPSFGLKAKVQGLQTYINKNDNNQSADNFLLNAESASQERPDNHSSSQKHRYLSKGLFIFISVTVILIVIILAEPSEPDNYISYTYNEPVKQRPKQPKDEYPILYATWKIRDTYRSNPPGIFTGGEVTINQNSASKISIPSAGILYDIKFLPLKPESPFNGYSQYSIECSSKPTIKGIAIFNSLDLIEIQCGIFTSKLMSRYPGY